MHAKPSLLLSVHLCDRVATRNSTTNLWMTQHLGLISNCDYEACREKVRTLRLWWRENNLSLNVDNTKDLIVVDRKQDQTGSHTLLTLNSDAIERVSNKFLVWYSHHYAWQYVISHMCMCVCVCTANVHIFVIFLSFSWLQVFYTFDLLPAKMTNYTEVFAEFLFIPLIYTVVHSIQ